MTRPRVVRCLIAGLVLAAAGPAGAADEDPATWRVTVTPYLWAAGLYGDVTVRGIPASLDASFIDILDNTDSLIGLQEHDWAVLAGYRALGQDYSTGSGRQRFQWDTVMRGPIIGLSIRF